MTVTVTAGAATDVLATSVVASVPGSMSRDVSVIVVSLTSGTGAAVTLGPTPAGWTALLTPDTGVNAGPPGTNYNVTQIYLRTWQLGDPSTLTIPVSIQSRIVICPLVLRGADPAGPVESLALTNPETTVNTGTDIAAPSLTPGAARTLVTVHAGRNTVAASKVLWTTHPSGMTSIVNYSGQSGSATNCAVDVCTQALTDASPTGVRNAVFGGTIMPIGVSLLLKDDPSPATGFFVGAAAPVQAITGTTVTAMIPATKAGDVTLAFVHSSGGNNITPTAPVGWTAVFGAGGIRPNGRLDSAVNVFVRSWAPGDPTNLAFTQSSTGYLIVAPVLVRGANVANPVEASAGVGLDLAVTGVLFPAPSLTPVKSRFLITCHAGKCGAAGVKTWTPPPGMTEIVDFGPNTTASSNTVEVCTKVLTDSSPTGTQSAVLSQTTYPVALSLLITPVMQPAVVRMKGGVPVTVRYKGQP